MARKKFKLTDEMKGEWIDSTIDYLRRLRMQPIPELADALRAQGVLRPVFMYKNEFLLKPHQAANKAWYLKSGRAKLYYYNEDGEERITYIWERDSIIVLFRKFQERLPNERYYIELMEDAELVAITNFDMDGIYEEHTDAYVLTLKILTGKTLRREKQKEILMMKDKLRRYCKLKELFPEFFLESKCLLRNEDVYAFIEVSKFTLAESRKVCA